MAFGTDRTVSVTLKASVASYVAGVKQAKSATTDFAKSTVAQANQHKAAWDKVGKGMILTGAAIAVGIGAAVKSYADFSKEMSNVQAVTGASSGEMKQLTAAVLEAGQRTKFSASEAAEATAELAKVGLSTSDILGGALNGALDLAAAGNLSLADAATYAGQTMKIFNLQGKDVPRIADALAAGANKSAADVSTLAQALQQGGLAAANAGLSMEDTVGTLSLFADNALQGSDAGTSLKTMLQRLTPQSAQAAATMKRLGLDFYDAQGNFVGIEAAAQMLQDRLGNLSQEQRTAALSTIFGSDAIRAATVLYKSGAAGVQQYVDGVSDQGAAARVAAIQMDNLSGDIEQLKGSIETGLIKAGSQANGVLRDLVQAATGAVNAFSSLPDGVQAVGLGLAGLLSAGLLAGGMFLTLVPKIAAAKAAMVELGVTSTFVKGLLGGPWGLALGAGVLALGLFAKGQLDAKRSADELRGSLDQQTGAITDNTKAMVAKRLQDEGVFDAARRAGVALKTVTDAALGQNDALQQLQTAQDTLKESTAGAQIAALEQGDAMKALTGGNVLLTGSTDKATAASVAQAAALGSIIAAVTPMNEVLSGQSQKQKEVAEATGSTTSATKGLTSAQYDAQASAEAQKKANDDLLQSIREGNTALLTARDSTRGYYAAVDAATKSVKENGRTLDVTTAKGRNNQQALDDLAQAALKMAADNLTNNKSIKSVGSQVDKARTQFVNMAVKMGLSRTAASRLATQMGLTSGKVQELASQIKNVPDKKDPKITVHGASTATSQARAVRDALNDIHDRTVTLSVNTFRTTTYQNEFRNGVTAPKKADGGLLRGPGTGTSDSIPLWGSNGEYMIRAAAVSKYGVDFMHQINAMRFADGGYVSRATSRTNTRVPAPAPVPSTTTVQVYGLTEDQAVAKVSRRLERDQRRREALMPRMA